MCFWLVVAKTSKVERAQTIKLTVQSQIQVLIAEMLWWKQLFVITSTIIFQTNLKKPKFKPILHFKPKFWQFFYLKPEQFWTSTTKNRNSDPKKPEIWQTWPFKTKLLRVFYPKPEQCWTWITKNQDFNKNLPFKPIFDSFLPKNWTILNLNNQKSKFGPQKARNLTNFALKTTP